MKRSIATVPKEAAGSFDLGKVVGQQEAFGMIAGRCSAAAAAAIRRVRQENTYRATGLSWRQFCPRYLGISRTHADRVIGYLEEFGPQYFEVTQLTRIPPEEYRRIAPAVRDGHIHWQGEAIALTPDNGPRVAAAVAALRAAGKPAALEPPPEPAPSANRQAIDALMHESGELVSHWRKLVDVRCTFAPQDRQAMRNMLGCIRQDVARLEERVFLPPSTASRRRDSR